MNALLQETALVRQAIAEKFGPQTIMLCRKIDPQLKFSLWYAFLTTLKAKQDQIIVAVLPLQIDHQIGSLRALEDLKWNSFHTRISEDEALFAELQAQPLNVHAKISKVSQEVLNSKCYLETQTANSHVFLCPQLPSLRIDLLVERKNARWSTEGKLNACLDTFACMVVFQHEE